MKRTSHNSASKKSSVAHTQGWPQIVTASRFGLLQKVSLLAVAVIIGAAGVHLLSPSHADTVVQPIGPGGTNWGLTFDDEFNSTSLDRTKWTPTWTSGDGGTSNNSTMLAANTTVSGGYLHLKTGSGTGVNGSGAIVNSDPNYGPHPGEMITPSSTNATFIEWRALIPGSGVTNHNWPALWLSSENWPGNGEIDAYEGFDQTTTHLEYGSAGSGPAPAYNNPGTGNVGGPVRDWTAGFHTWGVLYSPLAVTIYYDGQVESVYNNSDLGPTYHLLETEPPYSLKGPMMLIMENAYAHDQTANTDMQVDYVRVWQQGAASTAPDPGTGTTTPQITQTGNLLVGKTFTPTGLTDSTTESGPITNINDQNEVSRWISSPSDGAYETTDLGASYNLSKVSILWAGDTTKDYEIQTSADNSTWTTVYTGVTNSQSTPPQLIDSTTFTHPATGRYLRIHFIDRWNNTYGNSIYEIGAYGTATSGGTTTPPVTTSGQITQTNNLLTGKTFTPTNMTDSTTESGPITNINDQDETKRWISSPADNAYLTTDLGASYTLSKASILWAADTTKDYEIQMSPDNSTWTTVYTGVTNGLSTPPELTDTIPFTHAATGRYLRIHFIDRWNNTYGNSIYEIGAYGTLATTTTPPIAVPGDANGDGFVNSKDIATIIKNWGLPEPAGTNGDLNGNGKVDSADIATLIKYWPK
jgi:hypothetical protein